MSKKDILYLFNKHYGDRYEAYSSSIKSEKDNYFFMARDIVQQIFSSCWYS